MRAAEGTVYSSFTLEPSAPAGKERTVGTTPRNPRLTDGRPQVVPCGEPEIFLQSPLFSRRQGLT